MCRRPAENICYYLLLSLAICASWKSVFSDVKDDVHAVLRSGVHGGGNRVHIRESIGDIVALLLMTDL